MNWIRLLRLRTKSETKFFWGKSLIATIRKKDDSTPVTDANEDSNQIIVERLSPLTPDILITLTVTKNLLLQSSPSPKYDEIFQLFQFELI